MQHTNFAIDPNIPFIFPTPLVDGQRHGRGVIKLVTYAGINADVTIPHKLNRIATIVVPLDNGVNYLPKWRRGTVAWTINGVTVQFDTAAPAPGLFLWIV